MLPEDVFKPLKYRPIALSYMKLAPKCQMQQSVKVQSYSIVANLCAYLSVTHSIR